MESNYVITYNEKSYAIDLDALKKVCFISDNQKGKETEIKEVYTKNNEGVLDLLSRETKELKGTGNPQNDMIIYDIVKLLITALLANSSLTQTPSFINPDYDEEDDVDFVMDFSTSLAFNTCIKWGILVEVK